MGHDMKATFPKGAAFLATVAVAVLAAACSSTPASTPSAPITPHASRSVAGVVTSVRPSLLVIRTRTGSRTIVLVNSTTYVKSHVRVTGSDLAAGERVRVRLAEHVPTATAAAVSILGASVSGTVRAVAASGFTLTTRTGVAHAITVVPTTTYRQGRAVASASSLVVGVKVRVAGTIGANGSMVATSVRIH